MEQCISRNFSIIFMSLKANNYQNEIFYFDNKNKNYFNEK